MKQIKKYSYWFLSPLLGDDNRPSIKRFLILFFTFEIDRVIYTKPWNVYTIGIISIFVIVIGILLGLTTYQTLIKFFKIAKIKNEQEV
jgi:hypothetical protein